MSEETKDLYKLIGNYEATTRTLFGRLEKIDGVNGRILDTVKDIERACNNMDSRIKENSKDIAELEEHGVPKRTKQKIDTGLILGIFNTLVQLLKSAMGWM